MNRFFELKSELNQQKKIEKKVKLANSKNYSMQKSPTIAAAGLGWSVFKGIMDNDGDIRWKLDRMEGAKYPNDDEKKYKNVGIWKTQVVKVDSFYDQYGIDEISATFNLSFKYNGQAVGYIDIDNIKTNDALGWSLEVEAKIMVDPNNYFNKGSSDPISMIEVKFHFRFIMTVGSDKIWTDHYKLYGDGTYSNVGKWTQDNWWW
jgi:hypothetical protein